MQAPAPLAPAALGSSPSQASLNESSRPQRIFVASHKGMVGSAICRALTDTSQNNNAPVTLITRDRQSLDLTNQAAANQFFTSKKPEQI
jgi:GDP-L-fucose synthase